MPVFTTHPTPIGRLTLVAGAGGLCAVRFGGARAPGAARDPARLAGAVAQLDEYFAGERTCFDLPLDLGGTPFQRRVWAALRAIPYGMTTSYGALAAALGPPAGARERVAHLRAVGAAIGRTPTPIVVGCHRVVGADGSLTGYGGGLRRKRALLDFEATGGDPAALQAALVREQLALL